MTDQPFSVSPKALEQLHQLLKKKKEPVVLRICVDAGGCSGLKYALKLEDILDISEQDTYLLKLEEITIVTDAVSMPFLLGSQLDYEDAMIGASFVVLNPQAKSSCGCGSSFSLF